MSLLESFVSVWKSLASCSRFYAAHAVTEMFVFPFVCNLSVWWFKYVYVLFLCAFVYILMNLLSHQLSHTGQFI